MRDWSKLSSTVLISVLTVVIQSNALALNKFGSETLPGFYAAQSDYIKPGPGCYYWEAGSTLVSTVGTSFTWPDQLMDAAFESDGTLYGTGRYGRDLLRIDPMTGESTIVSSSHEYLGMAINSSGQAFSIVDGRYVEVDLYDGSIIRTLGSAGSLHAIAFDSQDRFFSIFHVAQGIPLRMGATLQHIELTTGGVLAEWTPMGLPMHNYPMAFAFDENNDIFILSCNTGVGDAPIVYQGNLGSGTLTSMMRLAPISTGYYSWALAYHVPTPSSVVVLLAIGGAVLRRRRRK